MALKTNPLTGNPYGKKNYSAEQVETLLSLVDVTVPADTIGRWTSEQLLDAGDWAMRVHLRASDNIVRVPSKPAFIEAAQLPKIYGNSGTVFDV